MAGEVGQQKERDKKKERKKIHSEIIPAISHSLIAYSNGISHFRMCDHTFNKGKNIIVPFVPSMAM